MVWQNDDGLNVRFGLEKAAVGTGGELETDGDLLESRFKITGTDVPATDAPLGDVPEAGLPSGAQIVSATLYVNTLFVGATATLDIGLFNDDGDGTYSTNDDDGIDAAIAVGALTAQAVIACDGALVAGALLAGTGDRPLYVSTGYNTAAFTAGEADLVIKYRKP